jgi:hypothetical protein
LLILVLSRALSDQHDLGGCWPNTKDDVLPLSVEGALFAPGHSSLQGF